MKDYSNESNRLGLLQEKQKDDRKIITRLTPTGKQGLVLPYEIMMNIENP